MQVQDHHMMTDDLNALWFTSWKRYADEVTVPILFALGEHAQELWGTSRRVRVEGIVAGAGVVMGYQRMIYQREVRSARG